MKTDISCNGGNNGTITTTVAGGTTPYTYNWGSGITTKDRTALVAATYNVTVTDANGCSTTRSITLAEPTALVTSSTTTNITCNGLNNGSMNLTVSGGVTPYTFAWSNAATTQNISALAPGTYTATITDANNCTKTQTKTITQPVAALSATATATPVNCFGGNNGSTTVSAAGGTAPYTYTWSNAATTSAISSLSAATYSVTVKDANNCTITTTTTVTQPVAAISATLTKTDISCNAGNNGTITTTVAGGTTPYTYNWGGGITTKDRTGLTAAAYSITVTDANGCSTTRSITLTEPTALVTSSTATNITCNGLNNGSMNLTVSGGVTPYTFAWSNAATTQNISALAPGTYTATITDANNCTKTQTKTITQPAAALSAAATATPVNCFGGNNGSATVSAAGGTTPYTYTWSNAATTAAISSLSAATYTVTVKDANNCTTTTTATVTQPAASISATLAKTDISCNAGSNGTITTTVAGGTTPYSYNWGGGITTKDRTVLTAAAYSITVTDANGCSTTRSITLTEPAALTVNSTATNVSCNGSNNGAMSLIVAGGITPYSFLWSTSATIQNIVSLVSGTYSVTVTDANNCSKALSKTITQPTVLAVTLNSGNTACTSATGTATAVTNNTGTAPYTYTWSNGAASSQNINGLAPGNISVTVTDAKGCTAEAATSIILSNNNTDAAFTSSGSLCAPNATVTFTHNGSASPLTHAWSFGTNNDSSTLTSPSYTYPTAGTYTVTHIVKRGFCADTVAKAVTITNAPVANGIALNVKCFGGNTGAIATTVNAGTSPFTYSWSNGQSTSGISNLSIGTYSVIVSDAVGCVDTLSATISQPAALSTSAIIKNTSCHAGTNGSIILSSSGGSSTHRYLWSNGAITKDISNLTAGTYTVTVSDLNNCSLVSSYTVTSPAVLTITASATPASCFGGNNGTINTIISGGTAPYSYNWEAGISTQNRTGLAANTYTVVATDSNGCSATASAIVTQPSALSTQLTATDAKCFGSTSGSVVCTATGGISPYKFKWNTGDSTQNINNKAAAVYTVTITDAKACTATGTATIGQPSALVATFTSTQPDCYNGSNGSATISATGGTTPYSIAWSNGGTAFTRASLSAGNYTATVTDANNCSTTKSISIAQPDSIKLSITANTAALCFSAANATATIAATGGTPTYIITWNDGGNTFARNDLSAGNYLVTVSDSKACTKKISFTTIQAAQLSATISAKDVSCFNGSNGSANASVTGGTAPFAFSWNNGSSTDSATGLAKGTYTLTITDANGCTLIKSTGINQPDSLTVSGTATAVACFAGNNGSISTTTTGGTAPYTYKWSNTKTTAAIQSLTAANYTLSVTDKKGCVAIEDFTVTQPDSINITANTQQPLCFGANNGNIAIAATGGNGGYTYQWSNNKTTANNSTIAAGTYSIIITDTKGCSTHRSFTIGQPAALAMTVSADNISCFGANDGSITIAATGGTTPYSINWSNGSQNAALSTLNPGTYTVTITDANGCSIVKAIQISEPQKLIIATTTADVSCFNGSNGIATARATGGTAPYSFTWSNASTNDTITNLAAGSYTVTVKDANACSTAATVTIAQPAVLSANSTSTDATCFGGNTGSIVVTTAGGTAPHTIKWNDNTTAFTKQGLTKGNYSATITDAKGCTTSISDSIAEPAKITISTIAKDVLCNGGNSGSIATTVAGGTAPYTFAWSDGSNQPNRAVLTTGSYKLTVTDNAGCTASGNAIVVAQPNLLTAQLTAKKVTCYNGSNGRAIATVSGGKAPYSFAWSNAGTNDTISNLTAGSYTVTITDSNACSTTQTIAISQPDSLTLNAVITTPLCNGAKTGSLFFNSVSGGTPGYTFKWSNGVQQADLNNIGAGTYTLTVTDNAGCNTSRPFTITEPTGIVVQLTATQNKCFGDSAATISVTANGGTGNLSYKWSNGKTSAAINTLKAGSYAVTIKDQNNCAVDTSIAINQPALISANASTKNNKCFGQTNGNIALHTAGGAQPYSFKWNTGANSDSISGLAKGTYTVTITDANNCAIINSFNITQPDTLHLGITATNPNCANQKSGMVMFNSISGGTPGYTFLWSNGQLSSELSAVGAGTYQVTITDMNGCTTSKSYTLTQPDSMMATAIITNPACSGTNAGNINLTITGGTAPFIYNWSNGKVTQDLQNISAGNYSVQISDSKGCYTTKSYVVTQPAPISFPASGSTTDVSCNGGSNGIITTSVSGGNAPYTYSWSNTSTLANLNNVVAGTYTVTITDAGGCTAKKQFTLNQPAAIMVSDSVKNINCNGLNNGSVKLKVSGGNAPYTYTWNTAGNTANISALAPGSYNVTVSDSKGCTIAKAYSISQPVALSVQGTASPVKCAGSSDGKVVSITSGGTQPYTYKWNTNETKDSITNKAAGNYTLNVSDARGCTSSAAFTIGNPAPLVLGNAKNDITCFGKHDGVINLNVQGGTPGYTYLWSNGMSVNRIANLASGKYYVTVKDRNNCAAKDSNFISEPSPVQLAATIKDVRCFGDKNGSVSITVSGGAQPYDYNWSNGGNAAAISQLGADKYYVTVTDAALCTNVGVATIAQPASIGNSFTKTTNKCFGDSTALLTAKANGGKAPYSYAWNTGSSNDTLFNLAANLYTVSVTDANGCSISDTASITQPLAIVISTEVMDASCEGKSDGSISVTSTFGTAPYTYVWAGSGTGPQARNLAKGSYYLTVTDANGCSKSSEVMVNEFPAVNAAAEVQHIGCKPGTDGQIHLTPAGGKAPYRYTWSNGNTTNAISTTQGGNFSVTVTDRNGCAYDTTFTIQAATGITINTIPAKTIKLGESVALTTTGSSQNITTWNWTPTYSEAGLDCDNCQNPNAEPTKTTTYHVTAIDDRGCEAHDTVTLTVIPDHSFYVPNLFSPNGDGENDFFSFYGNVDGVAKFNVMIFNRWGEKIFDSNDPKFKWDGTYKNVMQDPGVYVYVITLVFKDNAKPDDDMKGSITIVR